jgi:hypothetical protein
MFADIMVFLDSLKDVVVENIQIAIPSLTTFFAGFIAVDRYVKFFKSKKDNLLKATEISSLKGLLSNRIESIEKKNDDLVCKFEDAQKIISEDILKLGEAFNVLSVNSTKASEETKTKITDTISSLSAVTKEKSDILKNEVQEKIKEIVDVPVLEKIKKEIHNESTSLLTKFLEDISNKES